MTEHTNWGPVLVDIALLIAACVTHAWPLLFLALFTGGYRLQCETDETSDGDV